MLHITTNYTLSTLCCSPHKIVQGEGKLLGLPMNRALTDESGVPYDIVCGTFFVVGIGDERFYIPDGAADRKVSEEIRQ